MIFGYNTEIRQGDTVYHVQSEARSSEQVLETQIFVKGHCIGKHSVPSADAYPLGVQEALRQQHRSIVERIRAGKLDISALSVPDSAPITMPDPAPASMPDPVIAALSLRCIQVRREGMDLVLNFQVSQDGAPKSGLRLRCFLAEVNGGQPPVLISQPITDESGMVELRLGGTPPANAELQVELDSRTLRRFHLRQREAR